MRGHCHCSGGHLADALLPPERVRFDCPRAPSPIWPHDFDDDHSAAAAGHSGASPRTSGGNAPAGALAAAPAMHGTPSNGSSGRRRFKVRRLTQENMQTLPPVVAIRARQRPMVEPAVRVGAAGELLLEGVVPADARPLPLRHRVSHSHRPTLDGWSQLPECKA